MTPGPQLFVEQGGLMYTLMFGFFMANVIMYFQGLFAINWFDKAISAPPSILLSTILVMCLVGAYTLSNSIYSCIIALAFGCVGYVMLKYEYPNAPMAIALILGRMGEESLRQSLILSDGSPAIFFIRPISLICLITSAGVSFLPPILKYIKRERRAKVE
jgi:putative tricarboxylic transport membrane protein